MHNLGKDDGKGIGKTGFRDGLAFARDTLLIFNFTASVATSFLLVDGFTLASIFE